MTIWYRRSIGFVVLCPALVAICAAVAALALSPERARAGTASPPCSAAATQVWIGVGGGSGFAGGYAVPLEFSNIGRRSCTLYGYPGVSAVRGARQVGPAATRIPEAHSVVTLAPGATSYAFLRVTDTGALCGSSGVSADGFKVYAPGQRAARPIYTPVTVCAHRATLAVGAVRSGVGVPGYITQ
jgi:Protein of unknown function (DUF4232)